MRAILPAVLLGIPFVGCGKAGDSRSPATAPSTLPVLKAVDARYGRYRERLEVHAAITPQGFLRSIRTTMKSYGPGDIDPRNEKREIRQGQLTTAQMIELAGLFEGWDSLSDQKYGGVPDGGDVAVRYGEKTVSGGSAPIPSQVTTIYKRISEWAASMPRVEE